MKAPGDGARKVSLILMIAIYLSPILFWWLLLRRGYANSTRVAAFIYAAVTFGLLVAFAASQTAA